MTYQIGKLIVGYNPGIKQEINIGRSNNQNFVQIPFWQLRQKLKALVKRGLYQTKDKHLVCADINGSANILVKSKHGLNFERVSSGFLANPLRIFIS